MGCKGGMTEKAKTRRWKKLVWGTVRRVSSIKSVSQREEKGSQESKRRWEGWGC